jgi:putative flippase GtrA
MSNLDRRRGYTPRRAREQRAYRLALVGGAAGVVGVVSLVLAVVGAVTWALPIIALIVAAICMYGFQRATGQR